MKAKISLLLLLTTHCSLFTIFFSHAQTFGGSYDGNSMLTNAGCSYSISNIYKGGSYDGNNVLATAICSYTISNVYKGGAYEGSSILANAGCTYTISNVFIGGPCSGGYASVFTCPTQTWTVPSCAFRPPLALPIELLKFTAKAIDNKYVLTSWITATEINNDYFTVEKTKNAYQYEFVGQIKGAGNSSSTLSYQLIDTSPYQGTSYYRLKQTDYDGKYTYSDLVPVNLKGIDIINISPNPAINEFEYTIGSTENITLQVKVVDILGQIVINKTENIEKGITQKKIDISMLSSGTYILQIITENKEVRGKQFQIK